MARKVKSKNCKKPAAAKRASESKPKARQEVTKGVTFSLANFIAELLRCLDLVLAVSPPKIRVGTTHSGHLVCSELPAQPPCNMFQFLCQPPLAKVRNANDRDW